MTSTFQAPDIECEHCAEAIQSALIEVDGIQEVSVDIDTCTVRVGYDDARVNSTSVRAVLAEAGYPTAP
jgi:copper chaperone CopZ